MKLKDEIAQIRVEASRANEKGYMAAITRLLDFTAKAIAALEYYRNHYPGIEVRDGGDTAREVLALLDEDV